VLLATVAFLCVGCASVSVRNVEFGPTAQRLDTPRKIYIRLYELPESVTRVDRSGEEWKAFARQFQITFAEHLAERLSKNVAPARILLQPELPRDPKSWLIEGQFLQVSQGSRALRAVVGWGLGGTKLEVVTRISRLDRLPMTPLAVIETTGGSNAEPGAIFGGPFGAVPRLVITSASSGLTPDARRTARMITAAISEHLAKSDSPLPRGAMRPKRLGSLPMPEALARRPPPPPPRQQQKKAAAAR
jgi:hypothetical protein